MISRVLNSNIHLIYSEEEKMPLSATTSPNSKESMYFYMLSKELDDQQKKFLTRAIFANQEALLSSLDLTNMPHLVTKTDVNANDKDFLDQFTELLRETQNLKIDQTVSDNMLQSLYKTAPNNNSSQSSSARYKVSFVQALLAERKFFINLVRSLLRIVTQATNGLANNDPQGAKPIPVFQNDPFLEDEFQKLTHVRSQSSLNAPTQSVSKKYPIQRLLQPAGQTNDLNIAKGLSSRDLLGGGSDLIFNETPADLTTYSAKQPQQMSSMTQKLFAGAAASKTSMFKQDGNKRFTSEENEYHQGASSGGQATPTVNRVISDRNLGLARPKQLKQQSQQFQQQDGLFSFAEGYQAPVNGVYMAEGNQTDIAREKSPSFGNITGNISSNNTKSPLSQQALRQSSRKKSVLREYNQLFKRKEVVQLKHKWETDDEDEAADVTDSSNSKSEGEPTNAALSETGQGDLLGSPQKKKASESELIDDEDGGRERRANTKSVNTRRVQKPDQKQIVIGKRANVRNSNKFSKVVGTNGRTGQSNSRSPNRKQQQMRQVATQQSASQQQSGVLFSQNKNKKVTNIVASNPMLATQTSGSSQPPQLTNNVQQQPIRKQKITSRNSKRSDLYTKSVPSLTTEKPKTKEMVTTTSGGDLENKKATKLLKDASLALAMTMSPKSQNKTGQTIGTKKMANPQYTSSVNFERTYQSMSSQKKVIKVAASRSNSSNYSNKDGATSQMLSISDQNNHNSAIKRSNSPYRYTDEDYKESMCEPNELVQQLKQEQEFEYASLKTSCPQKGGKGGGQGMFSSKGHNQHQNHQPLLTTENGVVSIDSVTSASRSGSRRQDKNLSQQLGIIEQQSSEPDEYELKRTDKRKLTTSSSKNNQNLRVKSNANLSKQSQSKLLPTSTMSMSSAGQMIVEERPTQPKKLEKDAKLLFPSQNIGAKKSKLTESKMVVKQHSLPVGSQTSASRRSSEYKGGIHQVYQVKSVRDLRQVQETNQSALGPTQQLGGQNTRYTSDASCAKQPQRQSPKVAAHHSHHQSSQQNQSSHKQILQQSSFKKLNSQRAIVPSNYDKSLASTSSIAHNQKQLSKSGKRAIESVDSKHSAANKHNNLQLQQMISHQQQSPQLTNSNNHQTRSPDNTNSKVKQVVSQLAEIDKRTNKSNSYKYSNQQKGGIGGGSSHISQGQSRRSNNNMPLGATSSAYGGVKLNIHHDSSNNTNSTQQVHHMAHNSSQPGAFPVLQSSGKSSISPQQNGKQSEDEEENSCYDNDDEDANYNFGQVIVASKKTNSNDNEGLIRYTQEILDKELAGLGSLGISSMQLEDGPQTFDKESEDCSEMRQQIVFVNQSADNNSQMLKVSIAQNLAEPTESEKSERHKTRTQVHPLFYNKPSESVAQSYQHDILQEDFEDDEAMFEHLEGSETNNDGRSRHETYEDNFFQKEAPQYPGELSDKVSFNLNNMSQIKPNNNVDLSQKSAQLRAMSNVSSKQQFSIHKQSPDMPLSQGTQNTIRSAKQKHNMLLKGTSTVAQHQQTARPPLSKHSKDQNSHKTNSIVRSVSIDLLEKQQKQLVIENSSQVSKGVLSQTDLYKNSSKATVSQGDKEPTAQRVTYKLGGMQQTQREASLQQSLPSQTHENEGLRNQTIRTQVSQDIFSEDSMANHTESQQNFPNEHDTNEEAGQDDELEDAERSHKLSQVRMELFRGQEIRNSRKAVLSNRHMSSSSSERSCSSVQFKHQLKNIKLGSQEQSPSTKQQRLRKDRRKLFFGVDSSTERDDEEQEQEYGANDSNAVQEYTIVNVNKAKPKKTSQALASLKASQSFSPSPNNLRDKRASKNSNHEHYFGKKRGGGSDQDNVSSGGGLSQEDLDSSYNKFLVKQRTRRL